MPNWDKIQRTPPRPLVLAGRMAQAERTSRERGRRPSPSDLEAAGPLLQMVAEGRIPIDAKIERLIKATLEKQGRDVGLA